MIISGRNPSKIRIKKQVNFFAIWTTIYGKFEIDKKLNMNGIYQWIFKIKGNGKYISHVCIGIKSIHSMNYMSNQHGISDEYLFPKGCARVYGINCNGGIYGDSGLNCNVVSWMDYGFDDGDKITMQVNMKNDVVCFIKNEMINSSKTVSFDASKTYHMAVCIDQVHIEVDLLEFQVYP